MHISGGGWERPCVTQLVSTLTGPDLSLLFTSLFSPAPPSRKRGVVGVQNKSVNNK